jgi:hypothetical protein
MITCPYHLITDPVELIASLCSKYFSQCILIIYPEDGGSRFLRNVRKYCDVTPESRNGGVRSEVDFLDNGY